MTAILPVGYFKSSPFYVDERAQFFSNRLEFELLGDRFKVTTFALAIAYQVHESLSLGVGGPLQITYSVYQIYLKDAGDQDAETNQTRVEAIMSPYVGLVYIIRVTLSSVHAHFSSKTTLEGKGYSLWDFEYPEEQTYLKQDFSLTLSINRCTSRPGLSFDLSHLALELYGDLADQVVYVHLTT